MSVMFKSATVLTVAVLLSINAAQTRVPHAEKKADIAAAKEFFDRYQKLDLANDPTLADMYADNASIDAGTERLSGGVIWQHLTKKQLAEEINRTFKDEHLSALNKGTTYSHPHIKETVMPAENKAISAENKEPISAKNEPISAKNRKSENKAISVEFHGHRPHTGIKYTWLLQPDTNGDLKIVEEKSMTYSKLFKLPGQDHHETESQTPLSPQ